MLRCTALEQFFIDDQAAGSDVMAHAVFEVGRLIDNETVSASFEAAIARHPLLTSKISRRPNGKPFWISSSCHCLFFDVGSFLENIGPDGSIDLEHDNGFKVLVERLADRMRIQIRFHHAVCDGLAVIDFFKEWMSIGRGMIERREPDRHEITTSLLSTRGLSRWRTPQSIGRVASTFSLIINAVNWIIKRPIRVKSTTLFIDDDIRILRDSSTVSDLLKQSEYQNPLDQIDCDSRTFILNAEQISNLRKSSNQENSTLNCVIISRLFFLIRTLNTKINKRKYIKKSGVIRFSIPNSLRLREDQKMPACNLIGLAFIDLPFNNNISWNDVTYYVSSELSKIRKWNGGQAFVGGLSFVQKWAPLYKWLLNSDLCFATAVYSSVGDVSHIDPDIQYFSGKPPLRRNTNIVIFSSIVKGRLIVTVSMSRSHISVTDRASLFHQIHDVLKS